MSRKAEDRDGLRVEGMWRNAWESFLESIVDIYRRIYVMPLLLIVKILIAHYGNIITSCFVFVVRLIY